MNPTSIAKKISPNPAQWAQDIYMQATQQIPLIASYPMAIHEVQIEPESGTGFFLLMVGVPPMIAGIPVIISNFQLKPMDVFVAPDESFWPLTERRFAEFFSAIRIGRGLVMKDDQEVPRVSINDQVMPPPVSYRGAGGSLAAQEAMDTVAGGEKTGSSTQSGSVINSEDRSILRAIKNLAYPGDTNEFYRHVQSDPVTISGFARNKTIHLLKPILDAHPHTSGDLMHMKEHLLPKNVIWVHQEKNDSWKLRCVSDTAFEVMEKNLSGPDIVKYLGSEVPEISSLISSNRDVFIVQRSISFEPIVLEDYEPKIQNVTTPGEYMVMTEGHEVLKGIVLGPVHDYCGKELGYSIFTDGHRYTVQTSLVGEQIRGNVKVMPSELSGSGMGCWLIPVASGGYHAMLPFSVRAIGKIGESTFVRATSYHGEPVTFIKTPRIKGIVSRTGILCSDVGQHLDGNIYAVGDDVIFVNIGSKAVRVLENFPKTMQKAYYAKLMSENKPEHKDCYPELLKVIWNGSGFSFRGKPADDLNIHSSNDLNEAEAIFYLAILGCNESGARYVLNRARGLKEATIAGLRRVQEMIKAGSAEYDKLAKFAFSLRRCLTKEAATIPDTTSVDALLSLNFVNPENLSVFFEKMDQLKEVESTLAQMLVYSRLGHKELPEPAIQKALSSLNEVNETIESVGAVQQFIDDDQDMNIPEEKKIEARA